MTLCAYFHIGLMVPDIGAARAHFGAVFEAEFTTITAVEYNVAVPGTGELYHRVSHVCFSRQGPPYYELLQVGAAGLFGPQELGRVHHVGVWTPDTVATQTKLAARGVHTEAEVRTPEGRTRVWYSEPADAYGIRFEFLDETRRDWMRQYIATGTDPDAQLPTR
jgi:catechol 2,3-dioxygenase-like lactoylglutathione lyase family enzyme